MELAQLRRTLSIPYVMERYGLSPAEESDGKLHYLSPFRPDHNPSFDVWFDDVKGWRWGDYAESTQGSVVDLVKRLEKLDSDKEAIEKSWLLLTAQSQDDYKGPTLKPRVRNFDASGARAKLKAGRPEARRAIRNMQARMIHSHPGVAHIPTDVLYNEWKLSSDGDNILIPYSIRTPEGKTEIVGYKTRRPDDEKRNAKGMELALYGIWRLTDDENRPIWLGEGETSGWAAQYALPDFFVCTVPGTGHFPDKLRGVDRLAGRLVYLAFDSDDAGRKALGIWHRHLLSLSCDVRVVPLPEGLDPAAMHPDAIRLLPERARVALPRPQAFEEHDGQYCKVSLRGKLGEEEVIYSAVSNFSFELIRTLRGTDGEEAYEGLLRPGGTQAVLPVSALQSSSRLVSWAQEHGVDWTGTGNTTLLLAQLLRSESFLVPEGRMTSRVGYFDGDFVWHDGHIGSSDWTYVPPMNAIDVPSMVHIAESPCEPVEVLNGLAAMYAPEVMTPLLCWLAVAPLRPRFDQFPSVVVSGASGTGKTTLVEKVLRVFSGTSINATLTNTTPHAVASFFGAANAVPVWFDEYRPGARPDSKQQLDQMLRDAYTGQKSYKGGVYENKQALGVYDSDVPVIVTGEDSMIETSITDRSIMLRLTKKRQGDMDQIRHVDWAGFAYTYLWWLLDQDLDLTVEPEGPATLNDRQRYNLGVLRIGERLVRKFTYEHAPHEDPLVLDVSLVTDQAQEAAEENPIMDAVQWALEQELRSVWVDEEAIYVSADQLLADVKRADIFTLPVSNAKGLRQYLVDSYGGVTTRKRGPGDANARSVIAIPCGTLEP